MSINNIEDYLEELRSELKGSDPATLQDALSDAEDHLFSALENSRVEDATIAEEDALGPIIEAYGSPAETAHAYREIESRIPPALTGINRKFSNARTLKFFAIFIDPGAWGALMYMLFSMLTGIIYFTWAVAGFSFSLVSALFIFGLPLAAFFLLSIRGLALLEGRIVEALLGVRMPRRPLFINPDLPWQKRLKKGLADKHNWTIFLYLILQMPLGVFFFTVFITLFTISMAFMTTPLIQEFFHIQLFNFSGTSYFETHSWFPLGVAFGFILLTLMMHLAKWLGKLHAGYAKKMLISK